MDQDRSPNSNESQRPPAKARTAFEIYDGRDVRDLVEAYPLAWVIASGGREASLLPLVGVFDAEGGLTELIGHFALSNRLREAFAQDPEGTILFKGPGGYISPSQAGRRDWGPTWNYAQVRIQAEFSVEPGLTAVALELLAEHVERNRPEPWKPAELGARYDSLIRHIVGFRARVTRLDAKFKLGQTETAETFSTILSNLTNGELAEWMRRFDSRRADEAKVEPDSDRISPLSSSTRQVNGS